MVTCCCSPPATLHRRNGWSTTRATPSREVENASGASRHCDARRSSVAWSMCGIGAGGALLVRAIARTAGQCVTGAGLARPRRWARWSRGAPTPTRCCSVALSIIAINLHSAVRACSLVPGGPPAAHAFCLRSAASFSAAICLLRLIGCGTVCLTAIATVTMLVTRRHGRQCRVGPAHCRRAAHRWPTLALATLGCRAQILDRGHRHRPATAERRRAGRPRQPMSSDPSGTRPPHVDRTGHRLVRAPRHSARRSPSESS